MEKYQLYICDDISSAIVDEFIQHKECVIVRHEGECCGRGMCTYL